MSTSQDYADNTLKEAVDESSLDLSLAYNLTPRLLTEEELPDDQVRFYCQPCEAFVQVKPVLSTTKKQQTQKLRCEQCQEFARIHIGTERSLRNHWHLPPSA